MARLRQGGQMGDHDPQASWVQPAGNGAAAEQVARARSSPRKKVAKSYHGAEYSSGDEVKPKAALLPKIAPRPEQRAKQIRLTPLDTIPSRTLCDGAKKPTERPTKSRSPAKLETCTQTRTVPEHQRLQGHGIVRKTSTSSFSAEDDSEKSIWCESHNSSETSDDELPSPRKLLALKPLSKRLPFELYAGKHSHPLDSSVGASLEIANEAKPVAQPSSRPASSSDKENQAAFLHFSPPRLYSPTKRPVGERFTTPPQSPSKSRLQSPSKAKARLLTPPIRQSLDAFWDVDTVNNWNDENSPQKVLKSPKKLNFLKNAGPESPAESPRKGPSPSKGTKAEREAKKHFEQNKHLLAQNFLNELDKTITDGGLQRLAEPTGGVHFVWSKTLNSTAGRANWRKETTKAVNPDGSTQITHKHFASIELAEKVINDENRLRNVIAHEFCHLANFMISGIKDQPHGRQFKEWARKCTKAFGYQGIEVTTKHSYEIDYKYIWQCSNEDCAVEFKRHSKSIDPQRHTCGSCRSKLIQVKPIPRKDAGTGTGYAAYVKLHFAQLKQTMPSASQKEVMEAVGRKYRAEKAAGAPAIVEKEKIATNEIALDLEAVARKLQVVVLDDD